MLAVALVRQLEKVGARLSRSLCDFLFRRKNKDRLNMFLRIETTLKYSYIVQPDLHQEAKQSPFMLPSCLEAHATPRHENGDALLATLPLPASTR